MRNYFYSDRERGVIVFKFMGKTYNLPPKTPVEAPAIPANHRGYQRNLAQLLAAKKALGLKLVDQAFVDKLYKVDDSEKIPEPKSNVNPEDINEPENTADDSSEQVPEIDWEQREAELKEMTKRELQEYGNNELGLELDRTKLNKQPMINAIIEAERNA
jgi:hypothetical protein